MSRFLTALSAILICPLLLIAGSDRAYASPPTATIHFRAIVDFVFDPDNVLGEKVQVGDEIEGSYTFDTTKLDTRPDILDAGIYEYQNSPGEFEWTAQIGELTWTAIDIDPTPENADSRISVYDNFGAAQHDGYRLDVKGVDDFGDCGPDFHLTDVTMNLSTYDLNTITSLDLPRTLPDPLHFEAANQLILWINCSNYFYEIRAHLTELTTEPIPEPKGPIELLNDLIADVLEVNLSGGIQNSFDQKLEGALRSLDDLNQHNNVAAVNALNAFINAVNAQKGNQISIENADDLIAAAQIIIAQLGT